MAENLLDPSWYRVAALKPRLRPHVQVHRHHYRGQRWYVIQDASTGRFHRFSPVAQRLIGLMDGRRTLGRIWERVARELGDDVPTQGETLRLLHQLHAADVLQTDIPADIDELLRRYDRQRRQRLMQQLKSPLAIRLPLFDPERFLDATLWLARPLFGWTGGLLWLLVVGVALILAGLHWPGLTDDISGQVLAPQNLVLIWLTFPLVKALHELGHAYTVKLWGGEVHQIGVMFLVFMPVPYVDASASTAFRNKYKRALVGAAGMLVEVFLASLALFVWVAVEPGLVKAVAYNTMIIASVSTLLFNGNPLLRFDAYYILADLVEIPNLAQRANRYVFYLIQRHPFGVRDVESPASAPGEAGWFLLYAPLSFVYRMFIFSVIVVFVASQFFFLGVLIAIWASFNLFFTPMFKGIKFLAANEALRKKRARAITLSTLFFGVLVLFLFAVPLPLATMAEGIVWVPEGSQVRAGAGGFVTELIAQPGDTVRAGDVIAVLEDPLLPPELKVFEGELAALEARYDLVRREDRVRAEITLEQIEGIKARIARKQEQLSDLLVRAPMDGTLVLPGAKDMPHRFVNQGGLLGYVVEADRMTVRVVVSQAQVDLVRRRTRRVDIRRTEAAEVVIPAEISREVPTASLKLPSVALGTRAGGAIPIDPRDPSGETSLEKMFQFDLLLPPGIRTDYIGNRVYVRFGHGEEPLAYRWYRAIRGLFLSQFGV